jgi:hypothetical protein
MPRDRPRDLLNPTAGETRLFPASRGGCFVKVCPAGGRRFRP